jgi:hypothetical protein
MVTQLSEKSRSRNFNFPRVRFIIEYIDKFFKLFEFMYRFCLFMFTF